MGILALLSGLFAQLFTSSAAYFIALKILLYTLMVTILPIVLNNFMKAIIDGFITLTTNAVSGGTPPSMLIQFTGAAAGLASLLQLPFCFSIIVSALSFKLALRLIPFVRL